MQHLYSARELRLQLALQLIKEAPIRVLGNKLARVRLDQPRLVQPQRIEAERVLRVVLTPNVVADLAQILQRIVVALRVSLFDEQSRHALGIGRAEIGGLEYRAQHAFGGNWIFAGKLGAGYQYAAMILRPGPVV